MAPIVIAFLCILGVYVIVYIGLCARSFWRRPNRFGGTRAWNF